MGEDGQHAAELREAVRLHARGRQGGALGGVGTAALGHKGGGGGGWHAGVCSRCREIRPGCFAGFCARRCGGALRRCDGAAEWVGGGCWASILMLLLLLTVTVGLQGRR